jgi:TonB family protein
MFMYEPFKDESKPIDIKIPWDKNTARGFIIALVIVAILLLLAPVMYIPPPTKTNYEVSSIPIEILNFGNGDGTGRSKGNLSEEGIAYQGKKPLNVLEDAIVAANTQKSTNKPNIDPSSTSNLNPVNKMASNETNKNQNGWGQKNLGNPNGNPNGTGLGDKGSGKGLGSGLGDIEWGGGGNRTVLHKVLPDYPQGVSTNAQIKIKFSVAQDGTVLSMVPLQKGDPALERAAMNALRQWRFNPIKDNKEMYGIIPFTFVLR